MSFIEDHLGDELSIGSYTFTAEEIIHFASKFDPQPFHLDAEAAKNSVLGGLCASGWHTTAVFMKLNVASIVEATKDAMKRGEIPPTFGPHPVLKTSNGYVRFMLAIRSPISARSIRYVHLAHALVGRCST